MPRKSDDTPKGGWQGPGVPDLSNPGLRYAAGVKNGKWQWKPIDAAYLKWCEEQREKANGGVKPHPDHAPMPQVRQRTRKR